MAVFNRPTQAMKSWRPNQAVSAKKLDAMARGINSLTPQVSPPQQVRRSGSGLNALRNPIKVKNVSGMIIPAYSAVETTDRIIEKGYVEVTRPENGSAMAAKVLFSMDNTIAVNDYGYCYSAFDNEVMCYISEDEVSPFNSECGVEAGSFKVTAAEFGFMAVGYEEGYDDLGGGKLILRPFRQEQSIDNVAIAGTTIQRFNPFSCRAEVSHAEMVDKILRVSAFVYVGSPVRRLRIYGDTEYQDYLDIPIYRYPYNGQFLYGINELIECELSLGDDGLAISVRAECIQGLGYGPGWGEIAYQGLYTVDAATPARTILVDASSGSSFSSFANARADVNAEAVSLSSPGYYPYLQGSVLRWGTSYVVQRSILYFSHTIDAVSLQTYAGRGAHVSPQHQVYTWPLPASQFGRWVILYSLGAAPTTFSDVLSWTLYSTIISPEYPGSPTNPWFISEYYYEDYGNLVYHGQQGEDPEMHQDLSGLLAIAAGAAIYIAILEESDYLNNFAKFTNNGSSQFQATTQIG